MWWVSTKQFHSLLFVIAILINIGGCQKNDRPIVKLYLASSLLPLAADIKEWAQKQGHQIDTFFLTSSAIAKQIEQGAHCDAAILADDQWSDFLVKKNLSIKKIDAIAKNSLVIASKANIQSTTMRRWINNLKPHEKIIIGDPDYVPLGRYTKEALESLSLYERLFDNLMPVHSAHHASFLLKEKAAPYAVLYYTDAKINNFTIITSIDKSLHRHVKYPLLLCKPYRNQNILMNLFMSSDFNRALQKWGFLPSFTTTKSEML